ncbi:MAG: sodium:solute symporter [Actinobacteria bacterium]|nr:sodium:solute symporter [Actinomycetota bacterium]
MGVLVLLATLALFAWVGFTTDRGDEDLEEYLVARNSQSSWPLALTFFASGLGAWILFAPPEIGARAGVDAVVGYAVAAAAPILAFGLLGPRLRRLVPAGHSLTEFVRLRFGRAFHTYVVGISILYMWVFVTAELGAIGGVTAILAGLDARVTIVAVAAVTLAYTAYGGLRASLRTDRWQGWLVLALVAIAVVAIVAGFGDLGGTLDRSGGAGVDAAGVEAAVTLVIAVTAANLFHQGYWQRVWAARDDRDLRRGTLIGAGLTIPVVLVVGLLGTFAVGAGVSDPTATAIVPFFALVGGVATWVAVVVLVLGIALVASSVDTLENALASLVVAERPSLSLRDARIVTAVLLVPAAAVAFQGVSVLRLFLVADLLAAATVVPALLSLWRRATAPAVLAGGIGGLVGAVVAAAIGGGAVSIWDTVTFAAVVPTLPPFLGAIAGSTLVAVGLSLASGGDSELEELNARIPLLAERG